MSRRAKGRIGGPFVPVLKATKNTDAWRALSHGARSLFIELKGHYNSTLENAVYMSTRDAAKALGSFSRRENIMRWYRELEYYGFIRMISPAHHGVNGHGRAAHWRLTDVPYHGEIPTRNFERWDGEPFHEQKSPKHYQQKDRTDYQRKNRIRGPHGGTSAVHTPDQLGAETNPANGTSGPHGESICEPEGGPHGGSITSLTTPCPSLAPISDLSAVTDAASAVPDSAPNSIPDADLPWATVPEDDLSIPSYLDRRAEIDLSDPATIAAQWLRLEGLSKRLARFEPVRTAAK